MIKLSRYNFFQKRDDGTILAYNATSGALAVMTPENYDVYQSIEQKLKSGPEPTFDPAEQQLLKQLEYANFVYSGDYDEIDRLYFIHHAARFDDANIGLVMAPTMACNMACEYCYESNKKGRMNAETIEAVLSFLERYKGRAKGVQVSWYGGEPLLAMDIIEDLSESIIDMSEEFDFKYSAYIISNGCLLDEETVDKLVAMHVTGAQITLDGPGGMHNKKRPLKNGRDSYRTIIENLKYAATKLETTVRVNIDKNISVDKISEMLDDLDAAGLRENINIYFGLIEPLSSACGNITDNCFNMTEYSKIETKFFQLLFDRGFKVEKLPSPVSNHCVTQSIAGFVMDHEGYLYRCFNHIGDGTLSMGKIHDDINYYHHNFLNMFGFDPFGRQECRECDILPICMGGCPSRRGEQNMPDEELCASWKHNLPQMLDIIALSKQQQILASQKETS
jgi:uncharacterized protein